MNSEDQEGKIRKQWLIAYWAIYGIPLSTVLFFFGILALVLFLCGMLKVDELLWTILALIVLTGSRIIPMLITYNCAYKKRGTAWLLWLMILIPCKNLLLVLGALSKSKAYWQELVMLFPTAAVCIGLWLVLQVYFWINCFRLRQTNLKYGVSERASKAIKPSGSPL